MKNNIKVEINTTTINNFKPIASLNDTKLKQNIKIKKNKKTPEQFTREQNEQWSKWENGSISAMDLNPSSSQSLNQDFIKSTTSKAFVFLLSCALGQRLQGDALNDCVAHI